MTATTIRVQMAQRKDTAANWTAANPILLSGEIGYETDTEKFKIGDGTTNWNGLAYLPIPDGSGNLTITGNLEIGTTGTLTFEGSTANDYETTLAVTDPTADRTITLPDVNGTVVTTGDTGTVTSTMIADGTIVNADVSATAEIAVSKLANGTANQVLVTDGTDVSWSDDLTLAGNLTVNGTTTTVNTQTLVVEDKNIELGVVDTPTDTTADGGGITLKGATDKTISWVDATDAWTSSERFSVPLGTAAAPSLTFTGDTNTGIYSPGADQVAVATNGQGRLFVDASGNVGVNTNSITSYGASYRNLDVVGTDGAYITLKGTTTPITADFAADSTSAYLGSKTAHPLVFRTTDIERLRITSAGLVGIGTSSLRQVAGVTANVQAERTGAGGGAALSLLTNSSSGVPASLSLGASRGAAGTPTSVLSTDTVGLVNFFGADGTDYDKIVASIRARAVGTIATDRVPGQLEFYTAENADGSTLTQRLTIDNTGRVGIGSTPNRTLHVFGETALSNSANTGTLLVLPGAGGNYIYSRAADGAATAVPFILAVGTQEALRVDANARLLVGTSSTLDTNYGTTGGLLQVTGTSLPVIFAAYANDIYGGRLDFVKSRSTTINGKTIVQNGDNLGSVIWGGADGTNIIPSARIDTYVDGTPGANDMPGRLVFSTTADGASSPTERMRIDSNGFIKFHTTVNFPGNGNTDLGAVIEQSLTGSTLFVSRGDNPAGNFNRNNDGPLIGTYRSGVGVGSISVTTTATAYNTSSDYRLKENVVAVTDGITRLQQLKPSRFNFIADPDTTVDGFLAHEVQDIVPEAITGEKDAVDADGNPEYQGIDQSKLVPLLTAALQEAVTKIESLEVRLTAAGI